MLLLVRVCMGLQEWQTGIAEAFPGYEALVCVWDGSDAGARGGPDWWGSRPRDCRALIEDPIGYALPDTSGGGDGLVTVAGEVRGANWLRGGDPGGSLRRGRSGPRISAAQEVRQADGCARCSRLAKEDWHGGEVRQPGQ
ncbi:hypothetical protein NDU88_001777 [Pleurodeles waltl]|uniref:Uncharacterized protein n=1 Tax=Pleurodeles waltl TaxID=8319 RepID=A0AAV7MNM8_PLEWA|nr:hypothetical protein NDU88_001777 [Pleurodeles waltl]